MNPSTKLLLDEMRKLFAEQNAWLDRRFATAIAPTPTTSDNASVATATAPSTAALVTPAPAPPSAVGGLFRAAALPPPSPSVADALHCDQADTFATKLLQHSRGRASSIRNNDEIPNNLHRANQIDSPGHAELSSAVSATARISGSALIVADAAKGVRVQTHAAFRQTCVERLRPYLVFNKLDRLLTNLLVLSETLTPTPTPSKHRRTARRSLSAPSAASVVFTCYAACRVSPGSSRASSEASRGVPCYNANAEPDPEPEAEISVGRSTQMLLAMATNGYHEMAWLTHAAEATPTSSPTSTLPGASTPSLAMLSSIPQEHSSLGARQVFAELSLHADIFYNICTGFELSSRMSLGVNQHQPWPPSDELRLTSRDAELRPTPWSSFNRVERLSVRSSCGRLWKPPWPIQICQQIRFVLTNLAVSWKYMMIPVLGATAMCASVDLQPIPWPSFLFCWPKLTQLRSCHLWISYPNSSDGVFVTVKDSFQCASMRLARLHDSGRFRGKAQIHALVCLLGKHFIWAPWWCGTSLNRHTHDKFLCLHWMSSVLAHSLVVWCCHLHTTVSVGDTAGSDRVPLAAEVVLSVTARIAKGDWLHLSVPLNSLLLRQLRSVLQVVLLLDAEFGDIGPKHPWLPPKAGVSKSRGIDQGRISWPSLERSQGVVWVPFQKLIVSLQQKSGRRNDKICPQGVERKDEMMWIFLTWEWCSDFRLLLITTSWFSARLDGCIVQSPHLQLLFSAQFHIFSMSTPFENVDASSYAALPIPGGSQPLLSVSMAGCALIQERVQRKCGGNCQSFLLDETGQKFRVAGGEILPKPPWMSFDPSPLFKPKQHYNSKCASLQHALVRVIVSGNCWLAHLVFQLLRKAKVHWQAKQDLLRRLLSSDPSCTALLKSLLCYFELLSLDLGGAWNPSVSLRFVTGMQSLMLLDSGNFEIEVQMHVLLQVSWPSLISPCCSTIFWFHQFHCLQQNTSVGLWAGILELLQLHSWLCDSLMKQFFISSLMVQTLLTSSWQCIGLGIGQNFRVATPYIKCKVFCREFLLLDMGLLTTNKEVHCSVDCFSSTYSEEEFPQFPWDPGGSELLHRLGGKPNFKKGGMLGVTQEMGWSCTVSRWASWPLSMAQPKQLNNDGIQMGRCIRMEGISNIQKPNQVANILLLLCWLLLLLPEGESYWAQATGGPLPCGVGGRGRMARQHFTSGRSSSTRRTCSVLLLINTPAAAENRCEAANSKLLLLDHDGRSADGAGQCKYLA